MQASENDTASSSHSKLCTCCWQRSPLSWQMSQSPSGGRKIAPILIEFAVGHDRKKEANQIIVL